MSNKSPIAMAFSINDGYLNPFLVALVSIFIHAEVDTVYAIHVMNYKLSSVARQKIHTLVDKWHPQSSLTFLDVSERQWEQIPRVGTWAKEASYRLFLPELVPHWEKIIYLDGDIVAQSDLSVLYELDLSGKVFAGVRDEFWGGSMRIQQRMHYFSQAEGAVTQSYMSHSAYCNSGVLVLNLAFFREHDLTAKAIAMLNKYKDITGMLPDQDVLNYLATCDGQENIYFLPAVFNWNPNTFSGNSNTVTLTPPEDPYLNARWHAFLKRRNEWVTDQELLAIIKPQIIHFAGLDPWRFDHDKSEVNSLYEACALRSGWKIEDSFVSFRYKSFKLWLKRLGNKEKGLALLCFIFGLIVSGLLSWVFKS
jgi:lipopolysaccharide biosynthesis glycosyltransferase